MVGKYHDRRPEKWRGLPVVGYYQAERLRRLRWVKVQLSRLRQEYDSIVANFIDAMPQHKDRMCWVDTDGTPYLVMLLRNEPTIELDENVARELLSTSQIADMTKTVLDVELARQMVRDGRIDPETAELLFKMTVPKAYLKIVPDNEPKTS